MRLTKHGHACVAIEYDGARIVIDPGGFTEPEAVDGATSILVTHEHADHWDAELLRRTEVPVFTISAVAALLPPDVAERVTIVHPGDHIEPGAPVEVVGEKHAIIYEQMPHFDNSGYLLTLGDTTIFHPGDSLTVPDQHVDVLLLPVSAPWLKLSECIDYARSVGAPRNVAIHDRVYSPEGLGIIGNLIPRFLADRELTYQRLEPGSDL